MMGSIKWVVAQNQEEAESLSEEYGYETKEEAQVHLKWCREPPTDPFYGNKLHVYKVEKKENA